MLNRITTGWTITRFIYFLLGTLILIQGIIEKEWMLLIFGGYFGAMGLFAIGCAGGACNVPNYKSKSFSQLEAEEIKFEEITSKNHKQ